MLGLRDSPVSCGNCRKSGSLILSSEESKIVKNSTRMLHRHMFGDTLGISFISGNCGQQGLLQVSCPSSEASGSELLSESKAQTESSGSIHTCHENRSSTDINQFVRTVRWFLLLFAVYMGSTCLACTDIGENIRANDSQLTDFPCLNYSSSNATFLVSCSFHWPRDREDVCITLRENEVVEGNGNEIDLSGLENWEGLIQINQSGIDGFNTNQSIWN